MRILKILTILLFVVSMPVSVFAFDYPMGGDSDITHEDLGIVMTYEFKSFSADFPDGWEKYKDRFTYDKNGIIEYDENDVSVFNEFAAQYGHGYDYIYFETDNNCLLPSNVVEEIVSNKNVADLKEYTDINNNEKFVYRCKLQFLSDNDYTSEGIRDFAIRRIDDYNAVFAYIASLASVTSVYKDFFDTTKIPYTFKTYQTGDINLDEKITVEDSRDILRIAIGLNSLPKETLLKIADCDCDENISVSDARLALRIAIGLDKFSTNSFNVASHNSSYNPYY